MDVLGKQRHSAYGLFQQLSALRDQYFLLEISGCLSIKQKAILKCMWQQKVTFFWKGTCIDTDIIVLLLTHVLIFFLQRLFDSLLALSMDTNLLLGLFEDCHLSNCKEIRDESAMFSSLIKELQPGFTQCKVNNFYIIESRLIVPVGHLCEFLYSFSFRSGWTISLLEVQQHFLPVLRECHLLPRIWRKYLKQTCTKSASLRNSLKVWPLRSDQ